MANRKIPEMYELLDRVKGLEAGALRDRELVAEIKNKNAKLEELIEDFHELLDEMTQRLATAPDKAPSQASDTTNSGKPRHDALYNCVREMAAITGCTPILKNHGMVAYTSTELRELSHPPKSNEVDKPSD